MMAVVVDFHCELARRGVRRGVAGCSGGVQRARSDVDPGLGAGCGRYSAGGVRHSVVDGDAVGSGGRRQQVLADADALRSRRAGTSSLPVAGVRRPRRHGAGHSGPPLPETQAARRQGPRLHRHTHRTRRRRYADNITVCVAYSQLH